MNYFETLNDGAPCEGKLSCTVLSGGKSGDGIKGLPIAIGSGYPVCMSGLYADGTAVYLGDHRGMSGKLRCWLAGRFLHVQEVMNCLYGTL